VGDAAGEMTIRITLSVSADGEFELWVNPEGRDRLVKELQVLSEKNDHFHLGAWEGAEVEIGATPYRPTDKIVDVGKVLFRPDEWDQTYYPHVMQGSKKPE
jgi:hypothetical protein